MFVSVGELLKKDIPLQNKYIFQIGRVSEKEIRPDNLSNKEQDLLLI